MKVKKSLRILYALNKILGLSQNEIARQLGVSQMLVQAWFTGDSKPQDSSIHNLGNIFENFTTHATEFEEKRLRTILALLHVHYASPQLGNEEDPLDELFFILLSLKTSHRNYEEAYEHFKSRFYPWKKLLSTTAEEVNSYIRRCGFGSIKSRSFIDIAQRIKDDVGEVTLSHLSMLSDAELEKYLVSLPGVGLKTARCVMMHALGRDVIPVDTHTYRVGLRLGIVSTSHSTRAVHSSFSEVVPNGLAYALHTNFVALGRDVCKDPTPKCEKCVVNSHCDFGHQRHNQMSQPETKESNSSHNYQNSSSISPSSNSRPIAIDIYAGCGGLSTGIRDAGFYVSYALDWDEHACATHEFNFPEAIVECQDVRKIDGKSIRQTIGHDVNLLAGGPNCQGVSERGLRNPDDPRNFMFPEFVRLVEELQPTIFLMENVPGLSHRHNFELLRQIFSAFQQIGYRCAADVLLAANYGVPQLRHRFFMIGTLADFPLSFPAPAHFGNGAETLFDDSFVTIWEAIGDLPIIDASRQIDSQMTYAVSEPMNDFQNYARDGSEAVWNHICSATSEINLRRAISIPEGGNWKHIPPELLPARFFRCRMTDHSTTYARPRRDKPAFTVTSMFGNITAGAFTHPISNRAFSIREGARLQSFRDTFRFVGPRNSQYRQIGNAVPPLLARAVAHHLLALLEGQHPTSVQPRITTQVLEDRRAWDKLPVLTPRFKSLFGTATRWPKGWGPEPEDYSEKLDDNYSLRSEFWPTDIRKGWRKQKLPELFP